MFQNNPHIARRHFLRDCGVGLGKIALGSLHGGAIPLVLGGDHSVAAGSVTASAAYARTRQLPLGLLWIDAHGDMNTPATTLSGNVHGMPMASILVSPSDRKARLRMGNCLSPPSVGSGAGVMPMRAVPSSPSRTRAR